MARSCGVVPAFSAARKRSCDSGIIVTGGDEKVASKAED